MARGVAATRKLRACQCRAGHTVLRALSHLAGMSSSPVNKPNDISAVTEGGVGQVFARAALLSGSRLGQIAQGFSGRVQNTDPPPPPVSLEVQDIW